MNTLKVQFADILYNPEISGFQTRATIHDSGVAYVYPVQVSASLTAEFEYVAQKLAVKTHHLHANRQTSLHMHRLPMPAPEEAYPWAA